MSQPTSLQDRYAPANSCFGCGPSNPKGLQIKSFANGMESDSEVVAEWLSESHHEAFDGVLNGGIIGTLLDCHSNWTAIWHLMRRDDREQVPCTVTAEFHIRLMRPTPTDKAIESKGPKVTVEAELIAGGKVTATCRGVFVEVGEGHPAYHRWGEPAEN